MDTWAAQYAAEAAYRRDQAARNDDGMDAFEDALDRDEQAKRDEWTDSNHPPTQED